MKSTGILAAYRDDAGAPKEMRRQYRLKEGDSIEFFTDGERIVIEKHNVFSRSMEEIEYMYEILEKMKEGSVLFLHEEWLDKHQCSLSDVFLKRANVHRNVQFTDERVYTESAQRYQGYIFPIIVFGDWYGAFVLLRNDKNISETQIKITEAFAALLAKQLEH